MFKSVSDVLFKSYNFKVILTMFIDDTGSPVTEPKYKRSSYINIGEPRNPNEMKSVYFDTYSRALIGFCEISYSEDKKSSTGRSVYFSQRTFHEIEDAIDICLTWLKSKNFKYLYNLNSSGAVIGLGGPAPYNPVIYKNNSEFIRFFPAVVKDMNGVNYEGISVRDTRGSLTQFTCSEFLSFASAIKSYLRNSYGNNLTLMNTAMTFYMASKLKR